MVPLTQQRLTTPTTSSTVAAIHFPLTISRHVCVQPQPRVRVHNYRLLPVPSTRPGPLALYINYIRAHTRLAMAAKHMRHDCQLKDVHHVSIFRKNFGAKNPWCLDLRVRVSFKDLLHHETRRFQACITLLSPQF